MDPVILLTGATGFLGTWVARNLAERPGTRVLALIRAADTEEGERRLARAWADRPELLARLGGRIRALPGNLRASGLGLRPDAYADCVRQLTHIIHCAADLRLHAPLKALRGTNVEGTGEILRLARAAHLDHGLTRFSHVSTAYVSGGRSGSIREEDLSDAWGFDSAYEQSKYEAELLVREAMGDVPTSIFRPGMVVGDSRDGAIRTFNTFYIPLRLYMEGRAWVIPARRDLPVNIVPVDYVAEAVSRLSFEPRAEGLSFHLVLPETGQPRAWELAATVHGWARSTLGMRLPKPRFLPLPRGLQRLRMSLSPELRTLVALLPYFRSGRHFIRENLDRLLDVPVPDWRRFVPRLLESAVARGFMDQSERTVHEQVVHRLHSRNRPPRYLELSGGRLAEATPARLLHEIRLAAGALGALGIRKGDAVAIGPGGGTRRLCLETAVGLVGALSLPLGPPMRRGDIARALADSGVRLLFTEAARGSQESDAPSPETLLIPLAPGDGRPRGQALGWERFLELGATSPWSGTAPVRPEDPAILWYRSGTQGDPRIACFTHGQLLWLAQSAAALVPWRERARGGVFLSVLPPRDAVWQILAAYVPSFLPGSLLIGLAGKPEHAARLTRLMRPGVLVAPRAYYRRLATGIERNALGRLLLSPRLARGRPLVDAAVRFALLRRWGLDRCRLLVGAGGALDLEARARFRRLGLTIRQAYGLDIAPLVAFENVAGPLDPLPGTEIRLDSDGGILVRGPQTAVDCPASRPGPTGRSWVRTGDRGELTAEGRLRVLRRRTDRSPRGSTPR